MSKWEVTQYLKTWKNAFEYITVELCSKDAWAVRCHGHCLNKRGGWEYEPLPSGRSKPFLKRCRFSTAKQAMKAADMTGPLL